MKQYNRDMDTQRQTHKHSQGALGGGNIPQEPKIGRTPKTEQNQEMGTKRHLCPLDALQC